MAKIGSEHVKAMGRQGLRELRAAMYPDSNVVQQSEYGIYGTMTPGEVAEARRVDGRDLEDERPPASALESRMAAVESRGVEVPQRAEQEMDR